MDHTTGQAYTPLNIYINYGRPMEQGRPLYFCPVVSSIFFFLA